MTAPRISLVTVTQMGRLDCLRHRVREMQRQSKPFDEWIICGPTMALDALSDVTCWDARIKYLPSAEPAIVPRRNLCAEAATGDMILHVDDDDWQAPDRVRVQTNMLEMCDVTGTNWVYAYWRDTQQIQRISYWGAECNPVGATLAYRKSAWLERPFDAGEEGPFAAYHQAKGRFRDTRYATLILYSRGPNDFSDARNFRDSYKTRLSAHEIVKARLADPSKPLRLNWDNAFELEEQEHLSQVNRVYWRDLMGSDAWNYFREEKP